MTKCQITAGNERYCKSLNDYAKSRGFSFNVGNPGTGTLESYIGTVDNIVIHEDEGFADLEHLAGGWHSKYNKKNFSAISLNIIGINIPYILQASNYVNYIYITSGNKPDPWDSLPPYFVELIETLAEFEQNN